MFQPKHYVAKNFVFPYFVELVADDDAVTLRTYEEVTPAEGASGSPSHRFVGVHRSSSYDLPPFEGSVSPVGQHPALMNGARWPTFVPGTNGQGRVLVRGEELSPTLRGKFFTEVGAGCFDRKNDPNLRAEQWAESGEWMFCIDYSGRPVIPYNKNAFLNSKRISGGRFTTMFGHSPVLRLFQPFRDSSPAECSMYLSVHPALGFRDSRGIQWTEITTGNVDLRQMLPTLRWVESGPGEVAADQSITLALECVDSSTGQKVSVDQGEVLIEADSGYVPVRRHRLVDGSTAVTIKAWDLSKGHRIRVAARFEGSPYRFEREIPVV